MRGTLFVVLLLAASFMDLKRREIPGWVNGGIVALSFLHIRPECLLRITPALFFLAAAVRGGTGNGDVKLVAACGLVLGLQHTMMGTMLELLLQLLFHLCVRCVLPFSKRPVWFSYPTAPFLAIGCAVAYYV